MFNVNIQSSDIFALSRTFKNCSIFQYWLQTNSEG